MRAAIHLEIEMDRSLSLSQAARMVGVRRRVLQQQIQEGELHTFEGALRMSELMRVYPELQPEHSGMLEKTRRIREAAAVKGLGDTAADREHLAAEVHRLKIKLSLAEDQVASYKAFASETSERLLELQERCDSKQAMMLGALIGWYMHQVKLRDDEVK